MAGRIEDGRRRAHAAKRALAAASVAGFVALVGLARESHPGHAAATASQTAASATSSDGFFQPATVAPSSGAGADVQTHAS
jgi:hypothetical protein